jgi:hypothetical protein
MIDDKCEEEYEENLKEKVLLIKNKIFLTFLISFFLFLFT